MNNGTIVLPRQSYINPQSIDQCSSQRVDAVVILQSCKCAVSSVTVKLYDEQRNYACIIRRLTGPCATASSVENSSPISLIDSLVKCTSLICPFCDFHKLINSCISSSAPWKSHGAEGCLTGAFCSLVFRFRFKLHQEELRTASSTNGDCEIT